MFTPKNPLSINDCHMTAVNSAVIAVTAVTPSERFKTHLVYN
jgi:hypothetical protein